MGPIKALLERRGLREAWFSYEDAAITAAFDEWRESAGVVLVDRDR